MKSFLLLLFALAIGGATNINAQQNQKLDSLLNVYKNQEKEDVSKANLLNDIIQIELYNKPTEVENRINELIRLSKKIGYKKGEANGYYRKGGYHFARGELDSAVLYFKQLKNISNSINNIRGILNANEQLALVYSEQNKFDSTYQHLNDNIQLFEARDSLAQKDEFKYIGSTYHTMAGAYTQQGKYNLALKSELKALKLFERTNDELYLADALNTLGDIENNLGNYEQALDYLEPAYDTYLKSNDITFQIVALINIGNSYYNLKDYQKAKTYHERGIDLAKKAGHKARQAKLLGNLGNIHEKLNNIEKAISSQRNAIRLYNEIGNQIGILHPYANLGNLYRKTNDFEKSKYYLDMAIKEAEPHNLTKIASLAYNFRSKLYDKMGNYRLALDDHRMFTKLKDSMFNETKSLQIEELRTLYEMEQKEQQIALQENEIALLEERQRAATLQNTLLIGGIIALLALFGLLYYGIRQKMKRNKLQREKIVAELEFKKKELTTHALHLAKKNEVLEHVKQKAKALKSEENTRGYRDLIQTINFDQQDDKNWENFTQYFEQVHKNFSAQVTTKYPDITKNELRFMALLKMNMSSKEIATILNISDNGIKKARQRLRKKMQLSPEDSLETNVLAI